MTTRSDAELLQALREGDRGAGNELFARHAKASRALARRFGAGADTPDIVQEVWTQILRSPPELRGENLSGWLATTIRNRVTHYRRISGRLGTLSSRHLAPATGTTPTQRVAQREQLRRFWRALEAGELSGEELRLLALRYTSTSAEAGRELGVPASTYRGRARRALRKLVQIIGLDG